MIFFPLTVCVHVCVRCRRSITGVDVLSVEIGLRQRKIPLLLLPLFDVHAVLNH